MLRKSKDVNSYENLFLDTSDGGGKVALTSEDKAPMSRTNPKTFKVQFSQETKTDVTG